MNSAIRPQRSPPQRSPRRSFSSENPTTQSPPHRDPLVDGKSMESMMFELVDASLLFRADVPPIGRSEPALLVSTQLWRGPDGPWSERWTALLSAPRASANAAGQRRRRPVGTAGTSHDRVRRSANVTNSAGRPSAHRPATSAGRSAQSPGTQRPRVQLRAPSPGSRTRRRRVAPPPPDRRARPDRR